MLEIDILNSLRYNTNIKDSLPKANIYFNFVENRCANMDPYYKIFGRVRGKTDNLIHELIARKVYRQRAEEF